ncbi:hypothetical protein [Geothrix terrae]|uniref:hypothetical protein n=1 Tax=Geothrix terrae TaxID=2922720 RepID=UPI001FAB5058|nr:hypothetical protein [Geothrix terrae]
MISSFLLFLTLVPFRLVAGNPSVLGVLETPQCKEQSGIRVRALFAKSGKNWISLDNDQAGRRFLITKMEWIVIYEGKKLGSIETTDPGFSTEYPWTYSRDRVLNPISSHSFSSVKNKGKRFHGWCSIPEDRPLIVLSEGSAIDPSKWTRSTLSMKNKERLFGVFKKVAGRAFFCPKDPETSVPFQYTLKSIEVLDCLKDKDGRQLVTLRLRPIKESETCDGPPDTAWDQHTFLLSEGATYLGAGLELVGSGDFDGDGQSELLFWHSGYNEDGYLLFSSGLIQKAKYFWGYH